MTRARRRNFGVTVDAQHGGRWTSLTDPDGKEWLWARPDPARLAVRPGDAFVDVGGVEECLPTIGGTPDHGDVWTRPWRVTAGRLEVTTGALNLYRAISAGARVVVDYELRGPAGTTFVWALHMLLDPAEGTRIEAEPGPCRAWPGHVQLVETTWPDVLAIADYDTLGPDDGTAMFCLLPDRPFVTVRHGEARLRIRLACDGQPGSYGIWRNLGGYPFGQQDTYRNFGVEPMLGRVFDVTQAAPGEAARLPADGRLRWQVVIDQPE